MDANLREFGGLRILVGDALEKLRELPDESVHCCVTSPPYWGLRDYGTASWDGGNEGCDHLRNQLSSDRSTLHDAPEKKKMETGIPFGTECGKCGAKRIDSQLGLEKTPEKYVAKMVEVFREVRRVLRKDGTLWLNLGSSMAASGGQGEEGSSDGATGRGPRSMRIKSRFKPKDMVPIPWMVAMALQADGWYLRQDIIWAKPNPMPESVTDRCTKSHEYLFLLTKSARYFYDAQAIKEASSENEIGWKKSGPGESYNVSDRNDGGSPVGNGRYASNRNKRSVWTVATAPYPEAHFATYPPDLIKPCIMAGTSAKGCCAKCSAPWERLVESSKSFESGSGKAGNMPNGKQDLRASETNSTPDIRLGPVVSTKTIGWQPTCVCHLEYSSHPTIPGTVLDPFAGSGTTGQVALELGRSAILIELNPKYAQLIRDRCNVTPGLALAV